MSSRRRLLRRVLLVATTVACAVAMTGTAAFADVYNPPGSGNQGGGGGTGRGYISCDGVWHGSNGETLWYYLNHNYLCDGFSDSGPGAFAFSGFDVWNFYSHTNRNTNSKSIKWATWSRMNTNVLGYDHGTYHLYGPTPNDRNGPLGAFGTFMGGVDAPNPAYPVHNNWVKDSTWPFGIFSGSVGLQGVVRAPGIGDCRSLSSNVYPNALANAQTRDQAYAALWSVYHAYLRVVGGNRAVALQLTHLLSEGSGPKTQTTTRPVIDDDGNPVLDDKGKPVTEKTQVTTWPSPPVWNPAQTCDSALEFATAPTSNQQFDVVTCVMPTARYSRTMTRGSTVRYTPQVRGGERYWASGAYGVPQGNYPTERGLAAYMAGSATMGPWPWAIRGAYGPMYGTSPDRGSERTLDSIAVGPGYAADAVSRYAHCFSPQRQLAVLIPRIENIDSPPPEYVPISLAGPTVLHANGGIEPPEQRTYTATPGRLVCRGGTCSRAGVPPTQLETLSFKVRVAGTGGYRDCGTGASPDPGSCDFWVESSTKAGGKIQGVTKTAAQFYRATTGGQAVRVTIIDAKATARVFHTTINDPGNGFPPTVTSSSKVVAVPRIQLTPSGGITAPVIFSSSVAQ